MLKNQNQFLMKMMEYIYHHHYQHNMQLLFKIFLNQNLGLELKNTIKELKIKILRIFLIFQLSSDNNTMVSFA